MGCKASFAANSPAIGKKINAADRPSPCCHSPQGVMQSILKTDQTAGKRQVWCTQHSKLSIKRVAPKRAAPNTTQASIGKAERS